MHASNPPCRSETDDGDGSLQVNIEREVYTEMVQVAPGPNCIQPLPAARNRPARSPAVHPTTPTPPHLSTARQRQPLGGALADSPRPARRRPARADSRRQIRRSSGAARAGGGAAITVTQTRRRSAAARALAARTEVSA